MQRTRLPLRLQPRPVFHALSAAAQLLVALSLSLPLATPAQLVLSEFLAENRVGRRDNDGETQDWIEIHNAGLQTVSLAGWSLTDSRDEPRKWVFPDLPLGPGSFVLVFASGKDRRLPNQPLHTNFRLSTEGEYLALIRPDLQPATEFTPTYPPQIPDVSFGFPTDSIPVPLVPLPSACRLLVPKDDSLGTDWMDPEFLDTDWTPAATGVGWDPSGQFTSHITAPIAPAPGTTTSVLLRIPFVVTNAATLTELTLDVRYNDGFLAYLNGYPIAERNASEPRPRTIAESLTVESIPLDTARDRLVLGDNLLAFHLRNAAPGDPTLLLAPLLSARTSALRDADPLYFPTPTPSALNGTGVASLGPLIESVSHTPRVPSDADDLLISARIRPTLRPVANVRLVYRVMYGTEVSVTMSDDGLQDDGAANDGLWTARIPAAAAGPGQMVRWAIQATDTDGTTLRFPRYTDTRRTPQYLGAVIDDPSIAASRLPVLHWFVQNPGAVDTDTGSRGSLFFDGEFYDNVGANLHGQSTRSFPKKSYDFDFNPGFKFRWREGQPRVDDINLLTTWADKSHLRNVLAYETYAQAGAPAHFAIPVRVQQNARFFSVANLVENGDDNFLERLGLDPRGALYKMYNTANSTASAEKKTRKTEGTQDLAALIRGFSTGTTTARQTFMYDSLDLPVVINFLATRALTGDSDCCHKNYYVYRDSDGSGEWSFFPWDVDLTFGRVWTCGSPCLAYYDQTIYTNTGLNVGNNNTILSFVLNQPATRAMYLRRLRTLADTLGQPPGTPPDQDRWLQRTTQLRDQIGPDAALDLAKWGSWGRRETITQAVDRIHKEFLPARRNYLLSTLPRSGALPQAQPSNAVVRFTRTESRTPSGNRFHEFVELTNPNAYAVDLSDWRIEGPIHFQFKPGTVLPARSNAIISPDRRQFRLRPSSPRGNERRLILGDYSGELDSRGGRLTLLDPNHRIVHNLDLPANLSPAQAALRITEWMIDPEGADDAASEFVELMNTGSTPLRLLGIRFTEGIRFDFSTGAVTTLEPQQRVLIVSQPAAFQARYGQNLPVAGTFEGRLANSGEPVRLEDESGEPIAVVTLDLQPFPLARGLGHSLVLRDPTTPATTFVSPDSWKTSLRPGGSPGTAEPDAPSPPTARVVLHEFLAHSEAPLTDTIELHNPDPLPADISGWWLTDDASNPRRFRIPNGTVIPPHGFLVLDESQFNTRAANQPFSLSRLGEELWLFSTHPDGSLAGHVDGTRFGPSASGISFGRFTNSLGEISFPAQRSRTFGLPNSGPSLGPLVIDRILAAPRRGEIPYLQLRNLAATPVPLFDPRAPTNTWRITGIDFVFPPGLSLPAGGVALVVGGDPVSFRLLHAVPPDTLLLGPWAGTLQTEGESLSLERPDTPEPLTDGSIRVPYVVVDSVRFANRAPWPMLTTPGASLERVPALAFGNDPAHWQLSLPWQWTPPPVLPEYAAWQRRHFSPAELDDPALVADDADPDHDLQTNLAEFLSGTHPRDPQSVLRLSALHSEAGGMLLKVEVVPGRTYQIEWRDVHAPGPWHPLHPLTPVAAEEWITVFDPLLPVSGPGRLYRLRTSP